MESSLQKIKRRLAEKMLLRYAPPEITVALRQFQARKSQAFPTRNILITGTVRAKSALILSPHPDDEAIGMGGTLSMHLTNGCDLTVLYMTDGRGAGTNGTDLVEVRRSEAKSMGKKYRLKQIFWDIEDTRLTNDPTTVSALIDVLEEVRPGVIYLPSFFDHHFDHFAANQILVDALKDFLGSGIAICGYEVWDNMPFPNYFVDISRHFEKKREILSYYETPHKATDFTKLCEYRNALHYALHLKSAERPADGFAEAFCRLSAEAYRDLYHDYLQMLRDNKSLLPSHVMAH